MNKISSLDRYKKDLDRLIDEASQLWMVMLRSCDKAAFDEKVKKQLGTEKWADYIKKLPMFGEKYQAWYSESKVLLKQILPDRLEDFVRLFQKLPNRKEVTHENYTIEDYLNNYTITRAYDQKVLVGPSAALHRMEQQMNIIKSVKTRFESSLYDMRQILQADLFDSELDAARELNDKGFIRGAGAMAGVVLEAHLQEVCEKHTLSIQKKEPTINDYNELLKKSEVIDVPTWRSIQRLADLRNKCDHLKKAEPTKEEVYELTDGVDKIIKTLF